MERVYVANLPPDIRIKDIDDFFRPFGKLVSIDVNNRANPVCAYVQFDSPRNAFNAVKFRHGYDYEGYTLQLRLVENEVRKHRDATPPPSPPPMFNNYERQSRDVGYNDNRGSNFNRNRSEGKFSNSSFQSNCNYEWSNSRSNMNQQQNVSQYTSNNRKNMSQQIVPYSNSSHSSMQQQYSITNRSNIQQQYSNTNRSNMQQQNLGRSEMPDQNMNNYSNTNRSNVAQQQNMNMIDYSNIGSWDVGNTNISWNSGNYSSDRDNYDSAGGSRNYNSNSGSSVMPRLEENYTKGLSGSGRKWFNRYIRKGFSPEMARMKALEHRTVPYLRDDPNHKKVPGNSTNMALETIGNTIISLLSTNNQADNYNNGNWGGDYSETGYGVNMQDNNFAMASTSSTSRARVASQTPCNAVSKQQYIKSRYILRRLRSKRELSAKDRISKKYHTQIVRDYENFEKLTSKSGGDSTPRGGRSDTKIISTLSEAQLLVELRKKKKKLLMAAKHLGREANRRIGGGAYKKRVKILMNEAGFSELEAKALAVHPQEKLRALISIKKEYDLAIKKTDFMQANKKVLKKTPKIVVYRNDINYLSSYENQKISNLSSRIKIALRACIKRIHNYENEIKLPLTQSKFITLLLSNPGPKNKSSDNKQKDGNKDSKPTKTAKNSDNKEKEKQDNENKEAVDENPQVNNEDNADNNDDNVDNNEDNVDNNQEIIDITGEDNDEQFDDAEYPANEDEQNYEIEDQNEEE